MHPIIIRIVENLFTFSSTVKEVMLQRNESVGRFLYFIHLLVGEGERRERERYVWWIPFKRSNLKSYERKSFEKLFTFLAFALFQHKNIK